MEIAKEQVDLPKENKVEEQQELITDFSQMFKGKGGFKRMPKLSSSKQVQATPNWLLQIPARLDITRQEMCQRKVLDQRRWMSMAKSNSEEMDVLAAVVSSWNYLYSNKGVGELPALNVKKAREIMQSKGVQFESKIEYDRAEIVLSCFEALCAEFKVKATGKVLYKPKTPAKLQIQEKEALEKLLEGLKTQKKAYILITSNNILCPIGFDKIPLVPLDAFKQLEHIKEENLQLWIVNASVQRTAPSFVSKRWKHIQECLQTVWPQYLDLEEPKKGPQRHPLANVESETEDRGNSCCLLELNKCDES